MFFYLCWRERETVFFRFVSYLGFFNRKGKPISLRKNCCIFSKRIATVSTDVPGTYEIFSFSFRCSM
jgi:hypothetical protein